MGDCYIAGDIGGTNSRLQLFQVKSAAGLLSPGESSSNPAANEGEVLLAEHTYSSQVSCTIFTQQNNLILVPISKFVPHCYLLYV
jgi:glucokinase